MANNTSSTKGNKDNNSSVTNGSVINGASVTQKLQQAVVLSYKFDNKDCTGVMHVSQFPSTDRAQRDKMFADCEVGTTYDGLEASVEVADKSKGRRFTSVRLSGRAVLEKAEKSKREAVQAERQARESAVASAIESINGKVVKATVKKLAFSKDPATKTETDHCFGAFLKTQVGDVEVSGLLHTSRMTGKSRIDRLVAAYEASSELEVAVAVTEKGVAFSEEGVSEAKQRAAEAVRNARLANEAEGFLSCVREALAAGTADKLMFPAKVTENRLDNNGGVIAVACGVRVEVSSDDLAIPAANLRGTGHQLKLVPVSEKDGVVTAKRVVKGK